MPRVFLASLRAALAGSVVFCTATSAATAQSAGSPAAPDAAHLRQRARAQSAAAMQALDRARRAHDPVARCLDSTVSQLNSTRREIDERGARLERARAEGKLVEAEHETMVLRLLERRLDRLQAEQSCRTAVADAVTPTGETRVEMHVLGPQPIGEPVEL